MASFEKYEMKNGDVRWRYIIEAGYNPKNGKRKKLSKRGFKTRKEAKNEAILIEKQMLSGDFIQKNTTTFNEVFEMWREQQRTQTKPSTFDSVGSKFKKYILPYLGELRIQDIIKNYCQKFIGDLSSMKINMRTSKTKRPSSKYPIEKRNFKSLSEYKMYTAQVFQFAVEQDFIKSNPMKHVKVPKAPEEHIIDITNETVENFWDKECVIKFLNVLEEHGNQFDKLYFKLLLFTGLRKAEALGLLWEDIDFENETINIYKTLYFQKGKFLLLTAKTNKSTRVIKVDSDICKELKQFKAQRFLDDKRDPNKSFVFEREYNIPIRLPYPNERLNILIENGQLHPITVHGLRHTHASLLFESGANIKEVQERLGHSDIAMTMNIYTHLTNSVKEATVEKFKNFLNS